MEFGFGVQVNFPVVKIEWDGELELPRRHQSRPLKKSRKKHTKLYIHKRKEIGPYRDETDAFVLIECGKWKL